MWLTISYIYYNIAVGRLHLEGHSCLCALTFYPKARDRAEEIEMNEKLNILIGEDSPCDQEAARVLLSEHNLTIVGTFGEMIAHLTAPERLEYAHETATYYYKSASYAYGAEEPPGLEVLREGGNGPFDVVLTDNYMPVNLGMVCSVVEGERDVQTSPVGLQIMVKALMRGVKYVALVSRGERHGSLFNASLEWLSFSYGRDFDYDANEWEPSPIEGIETAGESRVMVEINPPRARARWDGELVYVKNWKWVLDRLTGVADPHKPLIGEEETPIF